MEGGEKGPQGVFGGAQMAAKSWVRVRVLRHPLVVPVYWNSPKRGAVCDEPSQTQSLHPTEGSVDRMCLLNPSDALAYVLCRAGLWGVSQKKITLY